MKTALLLVFGSVFVAGSAVFFFRGSELVVGEDYVGGLIHLLIGLGTSRGAIELARLAALSRP